MLVKHTRELESEITHLKKEIEYLQQGSLLYSDNKEQLAEETANRIEQLREEEVSYDLFNPGQQIQFRQNCLDLIHVEYHLQELRRDAAKFTNAKRVLAIESHSRIPKVCSRISKFTGCVSKAISQIHKGAFKSLQNSQLLLSENNIIDAVLASSVCSKIWP